MSQDNSRTYETPNFDVKKYEHYVNKFKRQRINDPNYPGRSKRRKPKRSGGRK